MEKIITVKQEPIDDAYPTPPSTTTASAPTATTATIATQNVTAKTTTVVTNDLFSSTIIYQVELYRFVLIFDSRHSWVNSTLTHPHRKKLARISSIIGPSKSGSTFLLNTVQLIVEFN